MLKQRSIKYLYLTTLSLHILFFCFLAVMNLFIIMGLLKIFMPASTITILFILILIIFLSKAFIENFKTIRFNKNNQLVSEIIDGNYIDLDGDKINKPHLVSVIVLNSVVILFSILTIIISVNYIINRIPDIALLYQFNFIYLIISISSLILSLVTILMDKNMIKRMKKDSKEIP